MVRCRQKMMTVGSHCCDFVMVLGCDRVPVCDGRVRVVDGDHGDFRELRSNTASICIGFRLSLLHLSVTGVVMQGLAVRVTILGNRNCIPSIHDLSSGTPCIPGKNMSWLIGVACRLIAVAGQRELLHRGHTVKW